MGVRAGFFRKAQGLMRPKDFGGPSFHILFESCLREFFKEEFFKREFFFFIFFKYPQIIYIYIMCLKHAWPKGLGIRPQAHAVIHRWRGVWIRGLPGVPIGGV